MKRYEVIDIVASLLEVPKDDCWIRDEDDMDPTQCDVNILIRIRDEAVLYKLEGVNGMVYKGYVLNIIALEETQFDACVYTNTAVSSLTTTDK